MPAILDITPHRTASVTPEDSIMEAARLMNELNVDVLRVCHGDSVVGLVTDRDITLRAGARGRTPRSMAVAKVMRWSSENESADGRALRSAAQPLRAETVATINRTPSR
jgi:CBS domain-containing protein